MQCSYRSVVILPSSIPHGLFIDCNTAIRSIRYAQFMIAYQILTKYLLVSLFVIVVNKLIDFWYWLRWIWAHWELSYQHSTNKTRRKPVPNVFLGMLVCMPSCRQLVDMIWMFLGSWAGGVGSAGFQQTSHLPLHAEWRCACQHDG